MQSFAKDTTKPEISGQLSIRRNRYWVSRWVEISNGVLFYYKARGDFEPRCVINLKGVVIQEYITQERKFEIGIKSPEIKSDGETLRLKFASEGEYNKWKSALSENSTGTTNRISVIDDKTLNATLSQIPMDEEEKNPEPIRQPSFDFGPEINALDLQFLNNNIGNSLGLLKANVHHFKSEGSNMMLIHNSSNLRVFQNTKPLNKQKFFTEFSKKVANKIYKFYKVDNHFGKFYFFLVVGIFFALAFMTTFVMLEFYNLQSLFLTILISLHIIYMAHQIIIETSKLFIGKKSPLELTVEELTINKAGEGFGPYKLKAISIIKASINELLFVLSHPETRIYWQSHIIDIKSKQTENMVTYQFDGGKIQEKFITTIYREGDLIYAVDHINLSILRIFEILYNTNENQHVIRFYTSTKSKNLSFLKPYESPNVLLGLSGYLHELIADTNSRLYYDYHAKNQNNRVLLRGSMFEVQKNYFPKSGTFVTEETDDEYSSPNPKSKKNLKGSVMEDPEINITKVGSNSQQQEKEMNTSKIISQPQAPQDPRIAQYMQKLEPLYDIAKRDADLTTNTRWEKIEDKEGCTVHFYDDADNKCMYVRAEGNVKLPPEAVMNGFEKYEIRLKFDKMIESGKRIEEITNNLSVEHVVFKGMFVVAGRDFVITATKKIEKDGSVLAAATSVEDDRVPPGKKFVRGELKYIVWFLRPNPTNPEITNVLIVICSDLKGTIARSLLKTAGGMQGLTVLGLQRYVEKNKGVLE